MMTIELEAADPSFTNRNMQHPINKSFSSPSVMHATATIETR
jgi:hypothetical protein